MQLAALTCRILFRRIYDGVDIGEADLERVRAAMRAGTPIVLPNHRSHLDYLLVSWVFYENDIALPLRVLMVLGGTAAGIAIAMTSAQGQRLWHFIQGSRVEIRKVVWPTRTETTQTAIAVFVFTLIMALFFWALDSGLLWLTRRLVG